MACPSKCSYCFGPHKGPIMSEDLALQTADYISLISNYLNLSTVIITFHGGEPLTAPITLWDIFLKRITLLQSSKKLKFHVQSNLWQLDNDFIKLFKRYNIEIGTSLDGPLKITDKQRGKGYYKNTYNGMKSADFHGFNINAIATFTPYSSDLWEDVFYYFLYRKINWSIHGSVKPLGIELNNNYFLSPDLYYQLINNIFPKYLKYRKHIQINTLDQFCRSVAFGKGSVCTFQQCFGKFLVIDPLGNLYSCQRFCDHTEFSLGNIKDKPSLQAIEDHPQAICFKEREALVKRHCENCSHLNYCHGGCYYNALAFNNIIDPFCEAYKKVFDYVKAGLVKEIKSKTNLDSVRQGQNIIANIPFLQQGQLASLTWKVHPSILGQKAKTLLALYELSRTNKIEHVVLNLISKGFILESYGIEHAIKKLKSLAIKNQLGFIKDNPFLPIEPDPVRNDRNFVWSDCKNSSCDYRYICKYLLTSYLRIKGMENETVLKLWCKSIAKNLDKALEKASQYITS